MTKWYKTANFTTASLKSSPVGNQASARPEIYYATTYQRKPCRQWRHICVAAHCWCCQTERRGEGIPSGLGTQVHRWRCQIDTHSRCHINKHLYRHRILVTQCRQIRWPQTAESIQIMLLICCVYLGLNAFMQHFTSLISYKIHTI